MKKAVALILIIILSPFIGGLYGILHDQLSYTLSSEYYTEFKFHQFYLEDFIGRNERTGVALVGFAATWWVGLLIGIVLGSVALIFKDAKHMIRFTAFAFLYTVLIAFCVGMIGFLIGKYFLINSNLNWFIPDGLQDKNAFIAVGSMHNFSYLGGLIGLIFSIFYLIRKNKKLKHEISKPLKR